VRCFADPDTHRRGDHDPSCSVNLEHGAWHCHACGARGGAFDAARARGYSDRGAIDLMVAYRLTEHRPFRHRDARARPTPKSISTRPVKSPRDPLRAIAGDIDRWQAALAADTDLIAKLSRERGWLYATMLELELGVDRGRVTIPVRDDACRLVALLRYQPWPQPGEPKMLATAGSRRALLPHPAAEPSTRVLLVEGKPDMIAARSYGLPAIAGPRRRRLNARLGAAPRRPRSHGPDGLRRTRTGRRGGDREGPLIARCRPSARPRASPNDGYDLTDWLLQRQRSAALAIDEVIASTGTSSHARTWKKHGRWPHEGRRGKTWQLGYRDHEGRVRSKSFKTKTAAETWAREYVTAERRNRLRQLRVA